MKKNRLISLLPYLILVVIVLSLQTLMNLGSSDNLDYAKFKSLMSLAEQKKIVLSDVNVNISDLVIDINGQYIKDNKTQSFKTRIIRSDETASYVNSQLSSYIRDPYANKDLINIVMTIVPYLIMGGFIVFMLSRMGGANSKAFDFSRSTARLESNIKIRFKDVAGVEEEKEEMKELIDYLRNPKRYDKMGARIPKGVLLVGPPGTGKTLLAKAVAGEADVPFYSISGSDFVEMFVGVGASRVRDLFKVAKKTAPSIIFIDEIDAVGRQRGAGLGGGHDEREQTLNQMLVEMDGVSDNAGILIIAATNRGDILDPALLRPGRFDRSIQVPLPDKKGRHEILQVHARNKSLDSSVSLESLASRTPGFSGADLENVLNEAAILAVRERKDIIEMHHLDEAIDRVMAGPAKKSRKYSDKEKKLVAYHETGHTIIGLKLEAASEVQKVTIIPRGEAGGYNLMTPKEETYYQTKSDLIGMITGLLGGRVAEEVVFGEISTGAYNDIERATKIARNMVMSYGMSSLGTIQYEQANHSVFLGRDYNQSNSYSSEIAFEIDKEVRKIIDEAYAKAKDLIIENRDLMEKIAQALLEYETLTKEQILTLERGEELVVDQQQALRPSSN